MNPAIRVSRPERGWMCGICGITLSTRVGAENHCSNPFELLPRSSWPPEKEDAMLLFGKKIRRTMQRVRAYNKRQASLENAVKNIKEDLKGFDVKEREMLFTRATTEMD